jgi:hypothetical protein
MMDQVNGIEFLQGGHDGPVPPRVANRRFSFNSHQSEKGDDKKFI